MEEPKYEEILKGKIDYYGETKAAYHFAAEEYARQQVKFIFSNLLVSGSATIKCDCGRDAHITKYCKVCDNDE